MTRMSPPAALESWRDYFRRGDSDIFGIIDNAIMVAASDFPTEFKSRRSGIAELLFSCKMSLCVGCDHLELSIAGDEDAQHGLKTVATVEVGGGGGDRDDSVYEDETKLNNSQIAGSYSSGEAQGLSDEQEASGIVEEVMRIRDILLNKEDEPKAVLLDSLRKLDSMSMSVELLKETKIGKAVNGLRKHRSSKITKLAKSLFREWKELVDKWMNTPKDIAGSHAGAEWTPESANFSVVDEQDAFPSPPHDLDFYAVDPSGIDLSQILDSLDMDDLRDFVESKDDGSWQSSSWKIPQGTNGANVVERYNEDQHMRREEADVRPVKHSDTDFDEPTRRPKQSRELNSVDSDAKFEVASRKLQERYQQHRNAKRQRTIQVLETIPKQSEPNEPQFKRPVRRS